VAARPKPELDDAPKLEEKPLFSLSPAFIPTLKLAEVPLL
jgi:hypothetical protein